MPNNDTATKKIKDFTAEEKALILARADKIEPSRVAKEFNTTWQVVSAIQRDARKKAGQAKQAKESKKASKQKAAPSKKAGKAKAKHSDENSAKKKLSNEEKNAILARANEIGATNAANEAGISKWTIFQWRKMLKKSGVAVEPLSRKKTTTVPSSAKNVKNTKAKKSAPKTEETPSSEKVQKVSRPAKSKAENAPNTLEFENALLKEQVASLTKQVEKLKAAISQLA